jgi:hypothetical protein
LSPREADLLLYRLPHLIMAEAKTLLKALACVSDIPARLRLHNALAVAQTLAWRSQHKAQMHYAEVAAVKELASKKGRSKASARDQFMA